jgi:ribonuclease P protein component
MLRSATTFDAIQRSGEVRAHPLLLLRYLGNDLERVRWGFSTGKRVGGAVVRNRVRRRLREAARAVQPRIREGWDIMLVARPPSAAVRTGEFDAAILDLARRAGLLKAEP